MSVELDKLLESNLIVEVKMTKGKLQGRQGNIIAPYGHGSYYMTVQNIHGNMVESIHHESEFEVLEK